MVKERFIFTTRMVRLAMVKRSGTKFQSSRMRAACAASRAISVPMTPIAMPTSAWANGIRGCQHPNELAISLHIQQRFALLLKRLLYWGRSLFLHEARIADGHRLPKNACSYSSAWDRFKVLWSDQSQSPLSRQVSHRFCQRMFRVPFGACCKPQHLLFRSPLKWHDIGNLGASYRDRPSLVNKQHISPREGLQVFASLHQQAT